MSIQHANRGIVKKDLQLYYNREWFKSFPGESTSDISKPISISPQGGSLTVATSWPSFNEDLSNGNYFKNVPTGGVLYHQVTNPALSNNQTLYNNNGGITSATTVPISGTYLIFSFYVHLTQLYTGYAGNLGGYINVNTNGGTNGTAGSVLTSYGWSFYVNGVLDNAWSNNSAYLNKWVRIVAVVNNGAISSSAKYFTNWYIYQDRLTGGSMYIADFQIEQKTYTTRPVSYDILSNTSNRGETTTNLITNPDFTSTSNWTGVTPWGTSTISVSTIGLKTYLNVVSTQNGNTPGILSDAITVTVGTVYTLSAYASRGAGAEAYLYVLNVSAASDLLWYGAALGTTEGWVVSKFTTPAGCTSIKVGILWASPSIGNTFSVEKMQLEQREYQSAFVNGSRTTNTVTGGGGLLDISGNNVNANLTNVVFDSAGYYFTTAGSNYINTGITTLPSNTQLTIDVWTKPTSTTQAKTLVSKWGSSSQSNFCFLLFLNFFAQGNIYFLVGNSAGTNYSTHSIAHNLSTSVYSNFTIVYDNGLISWYRNGVFIQTDTNGNVPLKSVTTAITIGADYDGGNSDTLTRNYDGTIPNVRLYSRPLTAAEVLQNFNATRKTYGL